MHFQVDYFWKKYPQNFFLAQNYPYISWSQHKETIEWRIAMLP